MSWAFRPQNPDGVRSLSSSAGRGGDRIFQGTDLSAVTLRSHPVFETDGLEDASFLGFGSAGTPRVPFLEEKLCPRLRQKRGRLSRFSLTVFLSSIVSARGLLWTPAHRDCLPIGVLPLPAGESLPSINTEDDLVSFD